MTDTKADPLLPVDPDFAAASFGPGVVFETGDEEQEDPPSAEKQVEDDLDERAQEDFRGLMYAGYLEDECTVAGHRFLLRTPTQEDRLDLGAVHKPYLNTMSVEPAFQMIFVSMYLRRIDSIPAPEPLNTSVSGVRTRFEWVKNSIVSPIVIGMLYLECMGLAARERAVVEHLDRLGGPSA